MLDMDQFLKLYAMEFFLKHWDGYADNTNNTYLYNDVTAVAAPGVGNVKFKMIPWGIDQTLQPDRPFKLGRDGLIAQLVRNDDARRKQLIDQIRAYRDTLFSREHPADGPETADRPNAGAAHGLRRAERRGGDRLGPPATAAGRIGRLHLRRVCPAPPSRSTSSSTTPARACTPATPSRFRRARPLRRTSRSTTSRCATTTTRRICGCSTTSGPESR